MKFMKQLFTQANMSIRHAFEGPMSKITSSINPTIVSTQINFEKFIMKKTLSVDPAIVYLPLSSGENCGCHCRCELYRIYESYTTTIPEKDYKITMLEINYGPISRIQFGEVGDAFHTRYEILPCTKSWVKNGSVPTQVSLKYATDKNGIYLIEHEFLDWN